MSLIFSSSSADSALLGVICDRCKVEIRDPIALAEVRHIRLHSGYGSLWGDENLVEIDLCDACAHHALSEYARVVPSSERLTGKRGLSVAGLHRSSLSAGAQDRFSVQAELAPTMPSGTWEKALAWVIYALRKYFIPVTLMWRPLKQWLRTLSARYDEEDRRLRSRYGLDS